MATYKIKLVSQANAIVLIIILLSIFICGVLLFIPHGLKNNGLSILFTFLAMTVAYFLWQRFVTGRTEWIIDDNRISIIWTRKFTLSGSSDFSLKWSEIEKISKGLDPQYYNLKIELVNGEIITFYHDNLTTRDDFDELLKILHQTFNNKKATINMGLPKA